MQAISQTFKSKFPEYFEDEQEGALSRRLQHIESMEERSIGPLDLLYMQRMVEIPGGPPRILSSYHHVIGNDCSNTATIAAYLTRILQSQPSTPSESWLHRLSTHRHPQNRPDRTSRGKIFRAIYCCYDAISGRDLRVEAHVPGSVRSYYVADPGKRDSMVPIEPAQWRQAAASAAVRTVVYGELMHPGLVHAGNDLKQVFMDAAELKPVFWKLGNPDGQRMASDRRSNLMIAACKYGADDAEFLRVFGEKIGDAALQAQALLSSQRQSEAVKLMQHAADTPQMLFLQSQFMAVHEQLDDAVFLLRRAIALSPTDVDLWIALATLQLRAGNHREALWALNSVNLPPVPANGLPALGKVLHFHRPCGTELPCDLAAEAKEGNKLTALRAESLTGNSADVYKVLCSLAGKIGWDALLDLRQSCFVMEHDYSYYTDTPRLGAAMSPTTRAVINTEKRVCERWLDEMFRLLYDDLCVLSVFTNEITHVKRHSAKYTRTSQEWASLGALCTRLDRPAVCAL